MGGLPTGRPTLVCGGPGCGKTLLAMEFIVRGATEYDEPGVFMAFEERATELAANVASIGLDIEKLQRQKKVRIDYVHIDKTEIEETGEYNLDGLFIRLEHAINSIGAKRVVLDTIENLFAGLDNEAILRSELRRLFHWMLEKKVTSIITGERGTQTFTRQGLEEYVSDCVILLDHRVKEQITTRLLRIVKYRGTVHGTNEYPFLIDSDGISVLPITSAQLDYPVSTEKISSGIPSLDRMLGNGSGFFKGSGILVSGSSGTGKTSLAASFANSICKRGKKCLYFAFEESPEQIMRNMLSIGIDLRTHSERGLFQCNASRPSLYGLEMHLVEIHRRIERFKPEAIVIDPISNLATVGMGPEVKGMLTRLVDYLQQQQITALFTTLTSSRERTEGEIASLVDVWIDLHEIESNSERNRGLFIMKSRGMKHSNQIREFVITDDGIDLVDVYLGPNGILTGSARETHQLEEATGAELRTHDLNRRDKEIARKRVVLEAKISSLKEEFESTKDDLNRTSQEEQMKKDIMKKNRESLTLRRYLNNGKKVKKKNGKKP